MSRIKRILYNDISNGPGIRTSVFFSGCPGVIWNKKTKKYDHCQGCFNKEAWDFKEGNPLDDFLIKQIQDSLHENIISGLSILGGEPLCKENQEAVATLIKYIRTYYKNSKNIWIWTGYIYTKNPFNKNRIPKTKWTRYILKNTDVLVDGPFISKLFNIKLKFRGSENQRIIKLNTI